MAPQRDTWLTVLRWLVGTATLVTGLLGLYTLATAWDFMTHEAIADPAFSPYRYLLVALLKLVSGVAILLRTKWSVPLVFAWLAAFTFVMLGHSPRENLTSSFFFSIAEQLAILGFLCVLWARGRLR